MFVLESEVVVLSVLLLVSLLFICDTKTFPNKRLGGEFLAPGDNASLLCPLPPQFI